MDSTFHVALVDNDIRRRAGISHCLARGGIHAEPFESVAEVIAAAPRADAFLVHDDERGVATLARSLAGAGEAPPIVAYAERPCPAAIVAAVQDGAVSYLTWPFDEHEFATALGHARARGSLIEGAQRREAAARTRIERLSRREREVLSGVASGLSNRMIAAQLAISPRTVEIHRANMLNKMGAPRTSDAIRIAVEASLLTAA